MRTFFTLLFILLLLMSCDATKKSDKKQEPQREKSVLGIAKKNNSSNKSGNVASYKYQTALKVVQNLIDARGTANPVAPEFEMTSMEQYVAWTNEHKIGLEEKAYDICTGFGADSLNAMAVLLAHELTHYYERHQSGYNWRISYANKTKMNKKDFNKINMITSVENESEADKRGIFLAQAAGYNGIGLMPEVLKKIYKEYGLSNKMPGYPSKQERVKIAEESDKQAKKLSAAFDMANYMTAIGEYDDATKYYDYVLKGFVSREIYNNAGICQMMAGMKAMPENTFTFIYPLEVDANTRISISGSRGGNGSIFRLSTKDRATLDRYLKKAIHMFSSALNLDEAYYPAILNTANAYVLMEKLRKAKYTVLVDLIDEDIEKKDTKTYTNTNVLLGIISVFENDTVSANKYFDKAIALGSQIAKYNKNQSTKTKTELASNWNKLSKINNKTLKTILDQEDVEEDKIEINLKIDDKLNLYKWSENNTKLYLSYGDKNNFVLIQCMDSTYTGKTKEGIGIGYDIKKVYSLYGDPHNILTFLQNEMLVYKNSKDNYGIIFKTQKNKVIGWCVYEM